MRKLLICDLDETLLGDSQSLHHLLDLLDEREAPTLAFATGRQTDRAIETLHEWNVTSGAYMIASVGTEIARRNGHDWEALASLPAGVDKGTASVWLAMHLGVPPSGIITCGNTMNDVAMLQLPCSSIAVDNTDHAVCEATHELPNTYRASASFAAGVIEGLQFFHWLDEYGWS